MARKKGATAYLTVAQLLNEAQRGSAHAHLRYAKALWELANEDAEATFTQLLVGMKWFMTVAEVRAGGAGSSPPGRLLAGGRGRGGGAPPGLRGAAHRD